MTNTTWFEDVPKIELHLHLEGAIPLESLWELLQKYGKDPSVPDLEALKARFLFRDFPHFIETWIWKDQFLRKYEDFTFIAEAVAMDLAKQNIRYAEVFYSPSCAFPNGLQTQKLTEAIRAGLSRARQTEVALIADLVRDNGVGNASRVLAEINEVKKLGIVGVTIGGSEQTYPPEPFAPVYERARSLGFHTSAHAGEAAGPESVWGAISSLKVDRIGHATRAIEDDRLVDYIAEHRIPIEICVLSNVRTKVVKSIGEHPVRKYFEKGIPISINTDDPKMFGNSLAQEYAVLHSEFGFSHAEIRKVILQSIDTSWLPDDRKRELERVFRSDPNWEGKPNG